MHFLFCFLCPPPLFRSVQSEITEREAVSLMSIFSMSQILKDSSEFAWFVVASIYIYILIIHIKKNDSIWFGRIAIDFFFFLKHNSSFMLYLLYVLCQFFFLFNKFSSFNKRILKLSIAIFSPPKYYH